MLKGRGIRNLLKGEVSGFVNAFKLPHLVSLTLNWRSYFSELIVDIELSM